MFTIYQLVQDFATIHSMKIQNHQKVMCHSPKMNIHVWSPVKWGTLIVNSVSRGYFFFQALPCTEVHHENARRWRSEGTLRS